MNNIDKKTQVMFILSILFILTITLVSVVITKYIFNNFDKTMIVKIITFAGALLGVYNCLLFDDLDNNIEKYKRNKIRKYIKRAHWIFMLELMIYSILMVLVLENINENTLIITKDILPFLTIITMIILFGIIVKIIEKFERKEN